MVKGKVVGIRSSITSEYLGKRVLHEDTIKFDRMVEYVIWRGGKRYVRGRHSYNPEVVFI